MPLNIRLLTLMLLGAILPGRGQEPKINFIEPSAAAPGKATRVIPHGDNIETNWTLWTSFPCQLTENTITIPADAPVGIGAVRAITPKGASAFHLFMIDDLPTASESSSNQTISAAQVIKPPIAIDGTCNDLAFDYYTFQARKGQEFSIEAVAQRLGSQADTVFRILDEKGHEWAFCDDGPGVGRDSRLIFKVPASGKYFLEVRDINYQGGPQYRYRLRIGSFPLLTVPYPPLIRKGTSTNVWVNSKTVKVCASEDAARIPLSVRGKSGSGFASVLVSGLEESIEKEPNDKLEQATTLRRSICGRFEKAKDRDLFGFVAEKDERLVIAARTRSLGSACDVLLNVLKADGSKLVEANVTGADEGTITNTFKEAGTYYAELQELTESASPDFVYRLTVSRLEPGFELFTEQDRCEAKDGVYTLKVSCARRQYDGPITVSVCEAEHLEIEDNVIAEKKNDTVLKLKLKDAFPRGKMMHVRLKGEAKVGESELIVPMTTLPALRKQFPKLPMPLPELDGLVALFVP
jgi:hypothetical protein